MLALPPTPSSTTNHNIPHRISMNRMHRLNKQKQHTPAFCVDVVNGTH